MDTLELLKDNPLTEEQVEILNRIRRNVKRSENEYVLYFVECNLPNLRKQLIDELGSTDNLNLLTLNIADYPKDEGLHIDEWVGEQKNRYQNEKPKQLLDGINIVGIEQLLPTDSNEQIIKTVSELNWRRSYFQAFSIPIIFWLPSYSLALLANQASDFYDWYSDIYHFESDFKQKNIAVFNQSKSLKHPSSNISAQHYQTSTEKESELKKLRALLDETNTLNDKAYIRSSMADLFFSMGRLDDALEYWEEAKKIVIEMNNKRAEQTILNNISQIYQSQGNYDKALEYLFEAQNLGENLDDKNGNQAISNNIALVYIADGEYNKALEELEKSLKMHAKIDDKVATSTHYTNMGSVYYKTGEYDKSFEYFNKALELSRIIENKLGVCSALNGIASIYHDREKKDLALQYLKEALEICNEVGDKVLSSTVLYNISSIYFEKENFDLALKHLNESLSISKEIGDTQNEKVTLSTINTIKSLIA